MSLTAGMVAGKSDFYGTSGTTFVNLGVSAAKDLVITESFSLPLSVSYILNPNRPAEEGEMHDELMDEEGDDPDRAFLVFAVSLFP